jgi:large subunit ribosomal protein L29
MKASELRSKTPAELTTLLLELRKNQFELRMQSATGQLAKVHLFKETRKDIARIKTIINEMKAGTAS